MSRRRPPPSPRASQRRSGRGARRARRSPCGALRSPRAHGSSRSSARAPRRGPPHPSRARRRPLCLGHGVPRAAPARSPHGPRRRDAARFELLLESATFRPDTSSATTAAEGASAAASVDSSLSSDRPESPPSRRAASRAAASSLSAASCARRSVATRRRPRLDGQRLLPRLDPRGARRARSRRRRRARPRQPRDDAPPRPPPLGAAPRRSPPPYRAPPAGAQLAASSDAERLELRAQLGERHVALIRRRARLPPQRREAVGRHAKRERLVHRLDACRRRRRRWRARWWAAATGAAARAWRRCPRRRTRRWAMRDAWSCWLASEQQPSRVALLGRRSGFLLRSSSTMPRSSDEYRSSSSGSRTPRVTTW